jgi:aminomethyltransferase
MLQTPLYQLHVDAGAKMVDFAGWMMPVVYTSIIEEHNWTRSNIGLFDVSHMGRLELTGITSAECLEYLCTRDMVNLEPGCTRYCLMCNETGGVLDDIMVSRFSDEKFYIVCNASNREKIVAHIQNNLKPGVSLVDLTLKTAMIAIQGPKVSKLIGRLLPGPLSNLPHRCAYVDQMMGIEFIAFRGGYTGEDGFEVVFPANVAALVWNQLLATTLDDEEVSKPIGLGARDTLRLEAALPLYGHEMNESIDPLTAGLSFAVSYDHEFIGKKALLKIRDAGPAKKHVGLKLTTRRAARNGFKVLNQGEPVGEVTSGSYAPTVDASIAMALVKTDLAQVGTKLQVDTGRDKLDATIVPLPFYRRQK